MSRYLAKSEKVAEGSLKDIMLQTGKPFAVLFRNCDIAVICDGSGSMESSDSRDGRVRFDVLTEELLKIQSQYPGKVCVIGFSNSAQVLTGGYPVLYGGGTNMVEGLLAAKPLDGTRAKLVLISDGCPDSQEKTLKVARTFKSKINTIFVGKPDDEDAKRFMAKLASVTGGSSKNDFCVGPNLLKNLETLLLTSGE
jgi:hypothetical protein